LSELKLLTRGRSTLNLPPLRDAPGEAEGPINPPLSFRLKLDATHPYLAERGVGLEIAEAFGLGYCSRGMMKGRICIPIHNEAGELVAYAGRWPGDSGWPEGEERYKLPPGFRKSHVLFNLNRVPDDDWHVVLVEGFFSVFRLYAIDVPAVALMGCSLSDEQIELLARRTKRITVLMDGDAAGRAARAGIVPRLAERLDVYAPLLPEGASPDTLDDDVLVGLISADPLP
jgi:DNA primase